MSDTAAIPGFQVYIVAMCAYFGAYFLYAVATLLLRSRPLGWLATGALVAAWGTHTVFLVERAAFYHRQYGGFLLPATNMFEAISYFSWLITLAYLIAERVLKTRAFALFALALPCIGMAYSAKAMAPDPRELFPSLKSYWLAFHISAMFISYTLFFMAFVFGLMYVLRAWGARAIGWLDKRYDLSYLDALSGRFILIGVPVISLGIGLGAVWANAAWGKPWGWDPKETWALITWFIYIVYLHFRSYRWFNGYRAALGSIIGFVSVLITFQGVNLLDSLFKTNSMHAYAEGGNPIGVLLILSVLLLVPLTLLFVPMPPAAVEHSRARLTEREGPGGRDRVPLPRRIGGGSAGGSLRERDGDRTDAAPAPQRKPHGEDR